MPQLDTSHSDTPGLTGNIMTATQRAFEAAMIDFKDKLKGHSFYDQIIQTTSIEQVYQDIEKLQDKQAKSGRLRHLSKIEPFLARLREYSGVVETFVQAKPDILALIWGPIKLLLLWADALKQSFDALLSALEDIGNVLPDFCELAEMFAGNNRLQALLVLYFRDILHFYLISTKFFSMRRLKVMFEMLWPSHRDRIQVVVKHMASHRDLMRKEVRMEEIRRADEMRNRELQHFVQTEEHNIAQEYASHRAHLAPKSYDADLYRFSEAVCNGTGKWLFRDQSFQNWLAGKDKAKPILWLRGIPGAGIVRVIIDGLDEIELTQRSTLIKELVRLSDECQECHILLTCRAESDISRDLDGKTTDLEVDKNNAGSIQVFINQTMGEWFKERDFAQEVQDQIQGWAAPLAFHAKGMFLYVKVIFRIIYYINDIEDIQNQLEHLPTSLEDAYGRVLQHINSPKDPQRSKLARSILGWVGCAPTPMTLKEIEQALLVDPKLPFKLPRVQSTVNVVQICGPIIDIADGYVQFVHFTVREYIFNGDIQNSISLSETALDLAIRCLVYMSQDHHDPDLTDDELDANIVWGAYRLHHFSSSFWLDLIYGYLTLSGSKTMPDTLTDQLRILLETRSSDAFTQSDQLKGSLHPAIPGLESQEPDLIEMLKGCADFQTSSTKSDFQINNPEQWLHTSPLSIPQISINLHKRLDFLDHKNLVLTKLLSYHYGPRYFRCGFLGCHYRHYGFETRSARRAHEKNHQKPWNCNFPGCRFATQGFISQKMRDEHLENGHSQAADPGLSGNIRLQKIEDEELHPLIFDLTETDRVEILTVLMPRLRKLHRFVQIEITIHAAKMGSHAILQLFNDSGLLTGAFYANNVMDWIKFRDLAQMTVRSESVDLSKIILCWVATLGLSSLSKYEIFRFRQAVEGIIRTIMKLEREDLFELWRPILTSGFSVAGNTVHVVNVFKSRGTIASTDNIPSRERMLLRIWEDSKIFDTRKAEERDRILRNIADSSCSVNLAYYAIQYGCKVDSKAYENCPTALQFAARKSTQRAADLMKFLLLQGADPNGGAVKHKRSAEITKIRDEKGAREISKWLGMTWEELVERTTEERERREENEKEN
ncbi:hypothetical protein BFJ72_g11220 [Fusarium proliferatum]|uniref:NACHT domain-containing protein n=1 Tax=Gibberella intermedia TaxID=948311 RepID=A0A420SPL7_GIBIN|nr:hypothetical protein BFJ72_g11220 [Fusarium proliferatum]